MSPPARAPDAPESAGWLVPGSMVLRLMLVAVVAVALSGVLSAWLVTRASAQEAVRRVVNQQTDEVEVVARLLASKIEQSQKVLRTVAAGITPGMLESPSSLEWVLQQGLPAVRFFDAIHVARQDGELRLNLRAGQREPASDLDPAERDALRRTLIDGKPMVSELIAGRTREARVMFTMPLHREDGTVQGVVAGSLRLQSQGLLPPSLALPAREESRLIIFTRDGTILSHSDPTRLMGDVREEAGLGPVYVQWQRNAVPVPERGATEQQGDHIVSMAGMPLPQWMVARVSESQALLAPLEGAQRRAWWLAAAAIGLSVLLVAGWMAWMAQPLARLGRAAREILQARPADAARADVAWPVARGEVGELVRAFEQLAQQGQAQQVQQQALQEHLRAILDHASVGIVITRNGVLDLVGRHVYQMLGYREGELEGQPARLIYASEADYRAVGARVHAEFAAHGAFDGDLCFMRKDGTPVWARAQGRGVQPDDTGAGTVWILEDITAAREAQLQRTWEQTHDALTQLFNRPAFEQRLGLLLAERQDRPRGTAGGTGGDGVVLFLDLDHFTLVNDLAGHDAGDDVLRHVARLLESQVRQIGWVARLSGDEFAVVLPGCALARGLAVAEQLRVAVQAWEPSYQGRSFTLGVSIGLVVLDASLQDVQSVLYAGDMACYDAKRAGRNRVETRHASEATVSGRVALDPL